MKEPKRERNLKHIGGKWYWDFTFKGKRFRGFGGFTKDQARNTLAKVRIEKLDTALGFRVPTAEDVPFKKFADEFIELYAKPNKRSWRRDEYSLNRLKKFFDDASLQEISQEKIERYKAERQAAVSVATVNRELACLKTMFNKAVEWGRLEANLAARVKKFRERNQRDRILDAAEAQRLVACAGAEFKPVLIIALNTGMRRNEILSLKWKDTERGYIQIGDSKSGKSRIVPMNDSVREALKSIPQRPESEFIFYNPESKTHFKNVSGSFEVARKAAGLQDVTFHSLRHTAASKMVEAGVDLVTISKILGHASIQMTMRYAHPTPEHMRLAVEKLGETLEPSRRKVDISLITIPAPHPVSLTKYNN